MIRLPVRPFVGLALLAAGSLTASSADLVIAPTVRNWGEAFFSKEGYHTMTLSGAEMRPVSKDQVDVTDVNIVVWTRDAVPKVDTTIVSPEASYLLAKKYAYGKKAVRVVRDDVDITGEDWTYEYAENKVSIAKHVRVVFKAAVPDILK
jgi:hypothetical protein